MVDTTENSQNEIKELKRGGCLSAFLIAMFIFNPYAVISYLISIDRVVATNKNVSELLIYCLVIFSFANLVLAIATWKWKKIGVIGLWISAIIVFVINIYVGVALWKSFLGLLGAIILTILVIPKWSKFR